MPSIENQQLINKARELGKEYLCRYKGCAQTTLLAIADALDMKISNKLFKAMIGLSGQTGGCGSLCGAAAAIGLQFNLNMKEFEKDPKIRFKVYCLVKKIKDRFVKEYGSYLCVDIQEKLFGRTFDATIPQDKEAFEKANCSKVCSTVTEKAAGWAVKAILETEKHKIKSEM